MNTVRKYSLAPATIRFLLSIGLGTTFNLRDLRTYLEGRRQAISGLDVLRQVDVLLAVGLIRVKPHPAGSTRSASLAPFSISYLRGSPGDNCEEWLREILAVFEVVRLPSVGAQKQPARQLVDLAATFRIDLPSLKVGIITLSWSLKDPRLLICRKPPGKRNIVYRFLSGVRADLLEQVIRHMKRREGAISCESITNTLFGQAKTQLSQRERARLRREKYQVSEVLAAICGIRLPHAIERTDLADWILPDVDPDCIELREPPPRDA